MVSYRNTLHSEVMSPAPLLSVNQEWWLKQRGTKLKAEKDFFSFPFLWSGDVVSLSHLHFTLGGELFALPMCSAHSHSLLLINAPVSLLPIWATSAQAGSGCHLRGENRNPHSKEGENHWRWIFTSMGCAVIAENDWCIEPTLGHSEKLIHFLFTL